MLAVVRRAAVGVVVCSLALLAACASGPQNPSCTSSANCTGGLVCKAKECVAAGQCPSTQASCTTSSTCGAGASCQEGCCAPLAAGTCQTSADCTDIAAPHCDSGSCRACASNSECPNATICTPTGSCLPGCVKDADCGGGLKCFTSANGNWCGQCAQSVTCTDPLKPFCVGGFCTGCNGDADCSGTAPACDVAQHKCVPCLDSANGSDGTNPNCTGSAKACVKEVCVTCAPLKNDPGTGVNGACPSTAPVCDTTRTCIACSDAYDGAGDVNGACAASTPACLGKACLPCVTALNDASTGVNAACPSATPVCNTGNAGCVGCLADAHCPAAAYCSGSKTCTLPALSDLTPHTITVSTDASVDLNVFLDHAARVATGVAVSVTGGGTLDTATATVPAGANTVVFHYTAPGSAPAGNPVVTASLGGVNKQMTITVTDVPPALGSLTPNPASVQAGATVTLTVNMTVAVKVNTDVAITTDNAKGSAPATVTVLAGHQTADFTYTAGTAAATGVEVKGSYLGVDKSTFVDITPLSVVSVTPATPSVMKTATLPLTVNLSAAAAKDTTVDLAYDAAYGSGPATVTVLSGQTSASFNFTGVEVTPTTTAVTASLYGSSAHADVTVTTNLFHVGGTVTGLAPGATVTLQDNGGNNKDVSADGAFQFTGTIASGSPYAVTVLTDPGAERCHVANGSGNVGAGDVTNVQVSCGPKVMVVRVGDGTNTLSSTAAAVVNIEERDTIDGSLIRTIALPSGTPPTTPNPLTIAGSSTAEGGLSRSANGKYVSLAGYVAAPLATVPGATPGVLRVVGRVDAAGNIDTTTTTTAYSSANIRSAASDDGSAFWLTGSSGGVFYMPLAGSGAGTAVATNTSNMRHAHVFAGQVYATAATASGTAIFGVATIGTGEPTTNTGASTATAILPGFPTATGPSPFSFAVLDLDASVTGVDTIYVAQDLSAANTPASTVTVEKWTLPTTGGTWTRKSTFVPSYTPATGTTGVGARGLAAFVTGSGVRIIASTNETTPQLVTFVDTGTDTPTVTPLVTAPAKTAYRGVAVSPVP